jgi:sugar phosphate isomerase/epimerase
MNLAAFLTSIPDDFADAVRTCASLGFTRVDVVALIERPESHLEALADTGALVQCAAVGRDLPGRLTLDEWDVEMRRAALEHVQKQLADAARLGATVAYLTPPYLEGNSPPRIRLQLFGESCTLLADYAAQRGVRLCVEPVPNRLVTRGDRMLAWLGELGHPSLGLLLDVGHCLISNESAADLARAAGDRLGYVHLDDNDGAGDLHWPLLTGRLTRQHLLDLKTALDQVGYRGGLALELNPQNPEPVEALRQGRAIVHEVFG